MGDPISKPVAHGIQAIPMRMPSILMSGQRVTATVVMMRDKYVPEKQPYITQNAMRLEEEDTAIHAKADIALPRAQRIRIVTGPVESAI